MQIRVYDPSLQRTFPAELYVETRLWKYLKREMEKSIDTSGLEFMGDKAFVI